MPDSMETRPGTGTEMIPPFEPAVNRAFLSPAWLFAAVLLAVLLLLAFPGSRQALLLAVALAAHADIPTVKRYVWQFGIYAPLVSILLMVLHALLMPIPAPLIALVNGLLFGPWWGTLITWIGSMTGASLAFGISRIAGRGPLLHLLGTRRIAHYDGWIAQRGFQAILIARLIPVISFDLISFVAGLTAIPFASFVVGTALGILPATLAWNIVGDHFGNGPSGMLFAIIGATSLAIVVPFIAQILLKRYRSRRKALIQPRQAIEEE